MKNRRVFRMLSVGAVFLLAAAVPLLTRDEYYLHTFIVSGIYILLALGLNLILGYTGQLSLGHAAFYGIGAYTSALLVMHLHLPFWVGLIAAGCMAGLAGLLLGFPALRLKGAYLVICTLAFVEIVHQVMMNWESLTRGPMGIPGIPSPGDIALGGLVLHFASKATYYYLVLAVVAVTVLLNYFLIHSRTGRAFIAIREDQIAADMMGINLTFYKLLAFFSACFLAGIAGSLYVHYIGYVSPESFTLGESVNIVVMTILGGMGTLVGPVLGALGLTFLLEFMRAFADYRLVVYGAILMIVIVLFPEGAIGLFRLVRDSIRKPPAH